MSKVVYSHDYAGFGRLLRSEGMGNALLEVTNEIAARCGSGYSTDTKVMPTRVISSVFTETEEAYQDNLDNNTLLKASGV